ncbi:MAG: rhomboid family intramembrane serine protease [Bacteroidetes bacterium]|nr:rhomboid family intramembrane serine protease [Bacteroidota bacterium]
MNQAYGFGRFNILPPVVKNLLIINGLAFLASVVITERFGLNVFNLLGLHYWTSEAFSPYQIFTHLFIHANFEHIFFNMFSLWMFGAVIENYWGGKRFLTYYLITGLGAAIVYNFSKSIDIHMISTHLNPDQIALVKSEGYSIWQKQMNYTDHYMAALNEAINEPSVGASGAVYGILLAFGMIFPNSLIYLYFLVPIKAKYLIIGFIVLELSLGLMNKPTDHIAHFAHLGGMIFGYLLIKYWNKTNRQSLF